MMNIHASCIKINEKGILVIGNSGSGKSDLCLRLIKEFNAVLVADDRVDIEKEEEKIIASAPDNLKGLLEVRGVGIVKMPFLDSCFIDAVIKLVDDSEYVERLPEPEFFEINDIKIPKFTLHGNDISLSCKIMVIQSLL